MGLTLCHRLFLSKLQADFINLRAMMVVLFIVVAQLNLCGQGKTFNAFTDTLLILNGKTITEDKILIQREALNAMDTLKINQRGMVLEQFSFQAIALGQTVELKSTAPKLSAEMINEINNQDTKYKFIYIKDIILRTKDGRKVYPTTKTIKIVFIN